MLPRTILLLLAVAGAVTANEPVWAERAGGAARVRDLAAVYVRARGQRFDPDQTRRAGEASRHVGDYEIEARWAPGAARADLRWRTHTLYPFPNDYEFTERVTRAGGGIAGKDGFHPGHGGRLAPARRAARLKGLWHDHPLLVLARAETAEAGVYRWLDTEWAVGFDANGLPARMSTVEWDPLRGRIRNEIRYTDWRDVAGVPFPFRLEQRVDGMLVRREVRQEVRFGPDVQPAALPARDARPDAAETARGWRLSHFFHRRLAFGGAVDGDVSKPVRIVELAPGVHHARGKTHHQMVVVQERDLIVLDAPFFQTRSKVVLKKLAERWPDKPVSHVVLTHHHSDHGGGVVEYARRGAKVVVGRGNGPYFREMLRRHGLDDAVVEVVDHRRVLPGNRAVEVLVVPSDHAVGMVTAIVPDAKLLFTADMYSPGAPQHFLWSRELAFTIRYHALDVTHIVGGHGTMGTVAELEKSLRRE